MTHGERRRGGEGGGPPKGYEGGLYGPNEPGAPGAEVRGAGPEGIAVPQYAQKREPGTVGAPQPGQNAAVIVRT
jgi:hypothetical protein